MDSKLSPADMAGKLPDMTGDEIRDELQAYTIAEIKAIAKTAGIRLGNTAAKDLHIAKVASMVGFLRVHRGMMYRN